MNGEIERNLLSVANDKIILDGFSELGDIAAFQLLSSKKIVIYPHSDSIDSNNKIVSQIKESDGLKFCEDENFLNELKNINYTNGYFLFVNDRYFQIA